MASPPKLTGETLIVHHIPLVHCQVPDRQCCSSSKRTNPFCQRDLGITRTTSLPERHLSQTDSLLYSSLVQAFDPCAGPSEEAVNQARALKGPVANRRHNPFLLGDNEDEGENSDAVGQASFHLHNAVVSRPALQANDLNLSPFHLHETSTIVKPWNVPNRSGLVDGQEAKLLADSYQRRNNVNQGHLAHDFMEMDEYSCHHDGASIFSLDCGDQDWNNSSDESMRNQEILHSRTCSCSSSELQHCRCYSMSSQSEIMDQQMGYISDSSCNSSDGVLVNFSALYNKMNGHTRSNMNSGNLSCDSSFCSHSDTGAFYLDLHSSPAESKMSCESHPPESSEKACGCHRPSSPLFDANCNSYHLHCDPMPCPSESSDLTSCFQSQARLVVATQNYYKLVTCDLSSQSSPSPAGSSITSCSEDPTKGSPVQPTEYYLFRRPEQNQEKNHSERFRERPHRERVENAIEGQVYVNVSPPNPNTGRQRSRSYDRSLDRSPPVRLASLERMMSCPVKLSDSQAVSTRSSTTRRVTSFAELAKTRKKASFSPPNRMSGDSSLEFSPIPEFQKDRLVFADDGEHHSRSLPAMPFIHCLDRSCEDCDSDPGYGEGQRASSSNGSGSSDDSFPGNAGSEHVFHLELLDSGSSGLGRTHRDGRAKADGVVADSKSVFRYSKDQRPTTLPIQPFVFQHHFSKQVPKVHPLHSHFASSLSQLYSLSGHRAPSTQTSDSQSSTSASSAGYTVAGAGPAQTLCNVSKRSADGTASTGECSTKKLAPETTRPSPLGSYSPVRNNVPFFESMDSSSSSPTPERANEFHPPRSRSCPMSANLLSTRASPARGVTLPGAAQTTQPRKTEGLLLKEAPKMAPKKDAVMERNAHVSKYAFPPSPLPPVSSTSRVLSLDGGHLDRTNGNCEDPGKNTEENSMVPKHIHANHLSPQALKWREYRRRNPLGLERVSGLAGLAGSLDRKQQEPRSSRRSHLFDFPGGVHAANITSRLNGHSVKQLQINYSDFFPDYFSLTEKPPAEFCLSPDSTTESVSIDLMQKKGLVKAINTAVDLIVAHFGTSRDPGVKAKLGNSSVSPNVGHLILKYLCPAIRNILGDGLKAYVLDMIIGQRRNTPWSVVEASTQLGPSTKVLHSLFCKISQYSELTNHTMRFNAFIFGLLNIRSLEFWVNHLYNHEDIILAHFQPVGFMSLSHSICQVLIEEVLLLLQPLSLLPFNLDLLFEHHLFQMGREQQQKKELLRGKQDLQHSVHSTLQLMRTRGSAEDSSGGSAEDSSGRCEGTEDAKRDDEESIPQSLGLEKVKYERINGVGASVGESEKDEERKKVKESSTEVKKDKQAGWWYQLMQSSQVYIEGSGNGPKFVRYEKKKKPGAVTSVKEAETRKAPPPREGVVDGAEALAYVEGGMGERERQGICMEAAKQTVKDSRTQEPKEKNRPSWMGSPPESVLNEIKGNIQKEKRTMQESHTTEPKEETEEYKKDSPVTSEGSSSMKWGRLFGSRKQHVEGRPTNRLPSNWLSLDSSMLQFMAQTVSAGIWRDTSAEGEKLEKELLPEQLPSPSIVQPEGPPRQVKALCNHTATEAGQLSFKKGDILQVNSQVDSEWLYCGLRSMSGLVPWMYVTKMEDKGN